MCAVVAHDPVSFFHLSMPPVYLPSCPLSHCQTWHYILCNLSLRTLATLDRLFTRCGKPSLCQGRTSGRTAPSQHRVKRWSNITDVSDTSTQALSGGPISPETVEVRAGLPCASMHPPLFSLRCLPGTLPGSRSRSLSGSSSHCLTILLIVSLTCCASH